MPQIARAPAVVEQFVNRNDAEGADRGQSPHLGSAQLERVCVKEHSFPFPPTRQVQALAKHVARVDRVTVTDIVHALPRVPRHGVAGVGVAGIRILRHIYYRRVETRCGRSSS